MTVPQPMPLGNGMDCLMSTDAKAYVLAETVFGGGGRRLNQRDFPRRGAAGGETLIGRRAELATARAFIERARSDGEALLIFGDPGVGKTMLLDAAADMASSAGVCLLRASGVEFEAGISFSGLNQTLLPLLAEFAHLTASLRDALNVALGFGEGPAPDRLVVCNATLALLRRAAAAQPILIVIDDLPWFDRASAGVLWDSSHAASAAAGSACWGRRGRARKASSTAPGFPNSKYNPWKITQRTSSLRHTFRRFAQASASGSCPRRKATLLLCWSCQRRGSAAAVPRCRRCPQRCR
jgi:AAA ATPase domain